MPFDATDMSAFFDDDMPGYAVAVINGIDVPSLFRGPYGVVMDGMVGINSPSILCASNDVTAVVEGTPVAVHGATYSAISTERDLTTGFTRIALEET